MRKMIFSVPERLARRIDEVLEEDGFVNRPDFFRFLAMRYLDRRMDKVKDPAGQ